MLQGPDAIRAATILEDCVDQLCVLGRIMPTSFDSRVDAVEVCILFIDLKDVLFSCVCHWHKNLSDKVDSCV